MQIITDQLPNPPKNAYCALDIEVFGLNSKQIHRPTSGTFASMQICYEPGVVYVCTDPSRVQQYLDCIQDTIWLAHVSKFDLTHLRRWANIPPRSRLIDTHLIERILWNGYYDRFGLADLSRRYLDTHLDKSLQKKFESATELTPEFLEYAALDAHTTLLCWSEQKKIVTASDMKVYREIDLPALWAVMDFMPIRIDVDKWRELAVYHKQKQDEADAQLPFNIRSRKKAREYLAGCGFKGLPNVQGETLLAYINRYPNTEAARLARIAQESENYGMLSSRYGLKFIDSYAEKFDDIWGIVCDYNIIGAETGRMSASDPPLHGIPSRDTKVFRECFVARPGNKFIKLDYSQQEVAISAWHAQDKKLMGIYNSGQDVFIAAAKLMFNKDIEKSDPFRDNVMKPIIHGTDYGMTEHGLARKVGCSVDEAAEMIRVLHHTFPDLARYIDKQSKIKTKVYTAAGRRAWLNPYSDQCPNNALNDPIQGGGADLLKKSFARLHQEWDFDYPYPVVEVTHDEIGLDVPEHLVEPASKLAQDIMVQTANETYPGMKFRVGVTVKDSWS
jgi:DNA polymerase I-like protein with 3'-5' exonuclease and polymerase domains